MLLAAIDECHRGTYDFVYLPIDFRANAFLFLNTWSLWSICFIENNFLEKFCCTFSVLCHGRRKKLSFLHLSKGGGNDLLQEMECHFPEQLRKFKKMHNFFVKNSLI